MAIPQNFRDRAAKCDGMAVRAKDPQARDMFLEVASQWRALADLESRRLPKQADDMLSATTELACYVGYRTVASQR